MTASKITKTSARTFSLVDLVDEVLSGGVRIPEFQRPFRWQWEDVKRLMDSIVRGYPVGSMLLWARPARQENLTIGALKIEALHNDEALWVVDGQQRLTSLVSSLHIHGLSDPRFAIAYNLSRQTFVKAKASRDHVIDLPTIFDLQKLLRWFSEHPESGEYLEEATRIAKAIREYSIPAYIVKQGDEDILRDIFDRMNNYGKRLTRAEVFSALHEGTSDDSSSRSLAEISLNIDATYRFGEIDDNTIVSAILARRGADVTRDIRTEFSQERTASALQKKFQNETPDQAYRAGEDALKQAVSFLQSEAGVPHFSFLAYRYLLVILARFFAYYPRPVPRNTELLKRWFWRAVMVGPTGFGTGTQASRVLCSKIVPDDEVESIQSLLKAVSEYSSSSPPDIKRFRSTSANSRILLCVMWSYRPRSFQTGEPYLQDELGNALEGHQTANDIVVTVLPRDSEMSKSHAANRILFLGEAPIEEISDIFQHQPPSMTATEWQNLLESHVIEQTMQTALAKGDSLAFFELRENRLNQITVDFLNAKIKTSFEDTPPLASFTLDEEDTDPTANLDTEGFGNG
jgi:hypothetical protein